MIPAADQIERDCDEGWRLARQARGYLSENEARCLMIAAALSPAAGANVEIGSFMGRSTICLAHICKRYGLGRIVAIDPHSSPSTTDPDLGTETTSYDQFLANLRNAKLEDQVEPRVGYSTDIAGSWLESIRFLWIDGDHTYEGARADVRLYKRHLSPGALVLMHDVLGTHYGSLRTFVEEILESEDFGATGFCGSIGWGQYRPGAGVTAAQRLRRRLLAIPARQIMPVAQSGRGLVGWNKLRYKIWRPLAPHGRMTAMAMARKIRTDNGN
jgi:predicted O-methyltransferase YrrM